MPPGKGTRGIGATIDPATGDIARAGTHIATKRLNKSTGFNLDSKVSDKLRMGFDAHHATAQTGAVSPYGANNSLGMGGASRLP